MELGSYGGLDLLCQLISIRIWVNMSRIHTSCSYRDRAINQTLECEMMVGEINHKAKKEVGGLVRLRRYDWDLTPNYPNYGCLPMPIHPCFRIVEDRYCKI
ncbi:uncharacterized protein LOC111202165 [Brassica napus]|uniref:uncharacterized protein LOC111202165 n=1 Tax=Brassica napus TaxID=3708 RepID=UPI000BBE35DD|nr:uncharacterized protein LOC111202165 [Brassica napus]